MLVVLVFRLPPAAADGSGCAQPPPRYAWVETSAAVSERGYDSTRLRSTTRIGVPRDWPGAAGLLADASGDDAYGCLFAGGRPSSAAATISGDGAEVVVQSTEETALDVSDSLWGAEAAGLWGGRVSGWTRFVALLPSAGDPPPALAHATWRAVTFRAPEFSVRRVAPLPSAALPGQTYVWRDGATPPRVEIALRMSDRSAFQRWVRLQGPSVGAIATYLAFALPYLLPAGLLAALHRRSRDTGERRLIRITLGALGLILATATILLAGVLTGTFFLAGVLGVLDLAAQLTVAAALCL
ncbi:DUF6185 family protein, partial [Microbispora sp. ATCC PTA-5024]|uniref:DUF6185 family protein n=1 Tax=Microbispora sp. ATCC PTA-5024 TaxID=316330 RepID=UPI000563282F